MVQIKPAYLDRKSAAEFVALSEATMDKLLARQMFPKPRQLTEKRVGFLVRELEAWAEARPVSSNLPPANCGLRQDA